MLCPECHGLLSFKNAVLEMCPRCKTKICIPKTYWRRATLQACAVTLLYLVKTFTLFFKSPASFPLVMLWLALAFPILIGSMLLFGLLSIRLSPPLVQRIHANDTFTRLRLGD
jgi:hypothetical protein